MQSYFPLFIDISKIRTVIVGGGQIAQRRILTLQEFSTQITVIAPEITDELKNLAEFGQIRWIQREYRAGDFDDPAIGLAVIATNRREVNHEAGMAARNAGIPVSVADCKEESSYYFPGIIKKENVVVGVTASGLNHKEAACVTHKIREILEEL